MTGAIHILYLQLLPPPPPSVAPIKSRMDTFWYPLTQVHLENAVKTGVDRKPASDVLTNYNRFHLACQQALADAMTGISTYAKQGELNGFCDCVAHFANAVCGIVEHSSQVCLASTHVFVTCVACYRLESCMEIFPQVSRG